MIQFSSVSQLCPTLCDPMDCSMPGFPVLHKLPELAESHVHWVGDAIQTSLSYLSPPAFNLAQDQGLFQWLNSILLPWPIPVFCLHTREEAQIALFPKPRGTAKASWWKVTQWVSLIILCKFLTRKVTAIKMVRSGRTVGIKVHAGGEEAMRRLFVLKRTSALLFQSSWISPRLARSCFVQAGLWLSKAAVAPSSMPPSRSG